MRYRKLLFSVVFAAAISVPVQADQEMDDGIKYFLSGDLLKAAASFNAGYEKNPKDAESRELAGNCLVVIGRKAVKNRDFAAAEQAFLAARKIMPERADLQAMCIISEFENRYRTENNEALQDRTDVSREMSAVFSCIFTGVPEWVPSGNYVLHIAGNGETLGSIAQKYYNDYMLWEKIWRFNPQLKNPHRIFVGTKVYVPVD